jgi:histidinol-phosphate aminotransferase
MRVEDITPRYIQAISPYVPASRFPISPANSGSTRRASSSSHRTRIRSGRARASSRRSARAAAEATRYPDGAGFELKDVLAKRFTVAPEQIVLGNGSNDILELVAHAVLHPGASAVYAQHSFAVYPLATQAVGATCIEVRHATTATIWTRCAPQSRDDTRVVWLANPNNPTGTWSLRSASAASTRSLPSDVLVVLDEA